MAVYTKDSAKAGTTEYVATVYTLVPDPDGIRQSNDGNYREDTQVSRPYKTSFGASNWVRRQIGDYADVNQFEWISDSFHDEEYGQVIDAYPEIESIIYLWWDGNEWESEPT